MIKTLDAQLGISPIIEEYNSPQGDIKSITELSEFENLKRMKNSLLQ